MALKDRFLVKFLNRLVEGPKKVVSFGYPDMIVGDDTLRSLLRDKFDQLTWFDNSADMAKRHGVGQARFPRVEKLLELMGGELIVYDVVTEREVERYWDLNIKNFDFDPTPEFDLALDAGTLEHCFNAGTALMNMASCVKLGGLIMHQNPFISGNHGFYNLSPTLFCDFYEQNGFQVQECSPVTKPLRASGILHTDRFIPQIPEIDIFTIAQRVEIRPLVMPVQSKYKKATAAPKP